MERLLQWLRGYLVLTIEGRDCERFVRLLEHAGLLASHQYGYLGTNRGREQYCITIPAGDMSELYRYAHRCGIRFRICQKCGAPFFMRDIRWNPYRSLGLVLFVLLLGVFPRFVWNIHIEGNHVHTTEQLLGFLREEGVGIGSTLRDISCTELERSIRNRYPDITWVSCEKDGTKLNIRLTEKFYYVTKETSSLSEGDLVATSDGVIVSMIVRSGTALVSVGAEVHAGDVLVSGTRQLQNAYEEQLGESRCLADASILIESRIPVNQTFPFVQTVKEFHEKKKKQWSLYVAGKKILKYKSSIPTGNCDIITEYADLVIGQKLYLPVSVQKETVCETVERERTFTTKEVAAQAKVWYQGYLEALRREGYQLVSEHSQLEFDEKKGVLSGYVVVRKESTAVQEIAKEEPEQNGRDDDEHPRESSEKYIRGIGCTCEAY